MKVLLVSILSGIPVSLQLLFIAYLAPLIVYRVDYYKSMNKDTMTNPGRTSYLSKNAGSYPYTIIFYVTLLLVSLALFANKALIMLTMLLALLGILYSTVFKGFTRKIPGFKNVYTSVTWASGATFGLLLYYSLPFDTFFGLIFLFMFMRSLGNAIFFDLKDIKSDAIEGLKTVPVLIGTERTIMLLQALNVVSFLPLVIGVYLQKIPVYGLSMIVLAFFTLFNLRRANSTEAKRLGYKYYMLADAETILWPVILLIGKSIVTVL